MSRKFEIVLYDIGAYKDKLTRFLSDYIQISGVEADYLLAKLPAVIRKTNSKLEAAILVNQLKALGANVEVREVGTAVNTTSYNDSSNYSSSYSSRSSYRGDFYSKDSTLSNPDHFGPVDAGWPATYIKNYSPISAWKSRSIIEYILNINNETDNKEHSRFITSEYSSGPVSQATGCFVTFTAGVLLIMSGITLLGTILV
ncbi:MAG: hypothetical protein AB1782_03985 [Cyanobacteriota bacterium]